LKDPTDTKTASGLHSRTANLVTPANCRDHSQVVGPDTARDPQTDLLKTRWAYSALHDCRTGHSYLTNTRTDFIDLQYQTKEAQGRGLIHPDTRDTNHSTHNARRDGPPCLRCRRTAWRSPKCAVFDLYDRTTNDRRSWHGKGLAAAAIGRRRYFMLWTFEPCLLKPVTPIVKSSLGHDELAIRPATPRTDVSASVFGWYALG